MHHPPSDVHADDVAGVWSGAVNDRSPTGAIRAATDRTHQAVLFEIQKCLSDCGFGESGIAGDLGTRRLAVFSEPVQHEPLIESAHVGRSSCLRRSVAFHRHPPFSSTAFTDEPFHVGGLYVKKLS